jgi:UDP-glucose 4-epimerase
MRILVTGAFGYVGRAVSRRLVDAGHEVVALTGRTSPQAAPAYGGDRPLHVAAADLRDRAALRDALEGLDLDAVCHLAALTRVRESFEKPDEYRAVNTQGTLNLMDVLGETAPRPPDRPLRFVHGSTAAVYGAPERQPIDEDAVPAPTSPYGTSKLAADEAVLARAADGRIAAVVLRAFNAAGSVGGHGDPDESRIIPKALLVAAGRHPHLTVNGDGTAVRDFVHVDDLARAYLLALDGCTAGAARIYNVGATGASVADIVAAARTVTGRPVSVVHQPPQPEPPMLLADTRRIRDELGWEPKRSSLDELLADSWEAVSAAVR